MANPKIYLKPSAFKATKLYSAIPLDGKGDFVADRSSVATRVNSSGVVEEMAIDVPRVNYLDTLKYVNLLNYSEEISNSYSNWTEARIGTNELSNISNPVGAETRKYIANSTAGTHYISFDSNDITLKDSTTYTFSFYIKADIGKRVGITFKDKANSFTTNQFNLETQSWVGSAGAVDRGFTDEGNGWIRLWQADGSSTGAFTPSCQIYIYDNDGNISHSDDTMSIYITALQFEEGSSPTTYQPKTTGDNRTHYSQIASCPHLLCEPSSTNKLINSDDVGGASYTLDSGVAVTADDTTSPDNTTNGNLFDEGTATGTHSCRIYRSTYTNSTDYVASVFIKSGGIRNYRLNIFGFWANIDIMDKKLLSSSGINDWGVVEGYANGWVKVWIAVTSNATFSNYYVYALDDNNNISYTGTNRTCHVWGAEVKEGTVPSSYVASGGSETTKTADTVDQSGNVDLFNSEAGAIYVEMAALVDDNTDRVISISDGTANEKIHLSYNSTANQIEASYTTGGVAQCTLTHTLEDSTEYVKILFTYEEDAFDLYVDTDSAVASDVSGSVASADTFDRLHLTDSVGSNDLYAKVRDLRIYSGVLTSAEITEIFS